MLMSGYDDQNIFARILRGEIPCDIVYENEHALAFFDINPQAPVHILVIPKGSYISIQDFTQTASAAEVEGFWAAVGEAARVDPLIDRGFRIVSNSGSDAHQEVPHFHVHILGGGPLGPILNKNRDVFDSN